MVESEPFSEVMSSNSISDLDNKDVDQLKKIIYKLMTKL
jgi:hypothetical protein